MPSPRLEAEGARPREQLAALLELRGLELYRVLMPLAPRLAAGVLSGLLSAAEHLREGASVGLNVTNILTVTETQPGHAAAVIWFWLHRMAPPLDERSRAVEQHEVEAVQRALVDADHQLQQGEPVVEARVLLAALPVDLEAWVARAADQALATATEEERAMWEGRAPVEVVAEGLVVHVRRLQRAFGRRG